NYLLFCEHPHVYTLGKSGSEANLLLNKDGLENRNIEYFKINRGGDITYHGPGQIVGYPIIDLANYYTDLGKYLRTIEEVIIATLGEYNLKGFRIDGATGVWLGDENKARKICAIGVRASRWVTMHGWAFNINTDLSYFKNIVPCGITDKGVTSLKAELNSPIDENEVKQKLLFHFQKLFNFQMVEE
ncbi:UNVERIFIED_CONTAM: hypothetical protein GTU68_004988, partial [Idotea baltica]|nr:hypothetical protein [Idotea baltica]